MFMRGQWKAGSTHHWLFMDIGGHVPPLLEHLIRPLAFAQCIKRVTIA
jgi:hypothetical protein